MIKLNERKYGVKGSFSKLIQATVSVETDELRPAVPPTLPLLQWEGRSIFTIGINRVKWLHPRPMPAGFGEENIFCGVYTLLNESTLTGNPSRGAFLNGMFANIQPINNGIEQLTGHPTGLMNTRTKRGRLLLSNSWGQLRFGWNEVAPGEKRPQLKHAVLRACRLYREDKGHLFTGRRHDNLAGLVPVIPSEFKTNWFETARLECLHLHRQEISDPLNKLDHPEPEISLV